MLTYLGRRLLLTLPALFGVALQKYDGYWGVDEAGNQLPYLDGITFTFYPDPTARATAILTGDVDWIEYVPDVDGPALQTDPRVEVTGGGVAGGTTIPGGHDDAVDGTPYDERDVERACELLTAGRQEPDPEARRAVYLEAQQIVLEQSPQVFLFHSAQYSANRPNVEGYAHFPNNSYLGFRTTWLAR